MSDPPPSSEGYEDVPSSEFEAFSAPSRGAKDKSMDLDWKGEPPTKDTPSDQDDDAPGDEDDAPLSLSDVEVQSVPPSDLEQGDGDPVSLADLQKVLAAGVSPPAVLGSALGEGTEERPEGASPASRRPKKRGVKGPPVLPTREPGGGAAPNIPKPNPKAASLGAPKPKAKPKPAPRPPLKSRPEGNAPEPPPSRGRVDEAILGLSATSGSADVALAPIAGPDLSAFSPSAPDETKASEPASDEAPTSTKRSPKKKKKKQAKKGGKKSRDGDDAPASSRAPAATVAASSSAATTAVAKVDSVRADASEAKSEEPKRGGVVWLVLAGAAAIGLLVLLIGGSDESTTGANDAAEAAVTPPLTDASDDPSTGEVAPSEVAGEPADAVADAPDDSSPDDSSADDSGTDDSGTDDSSAMADAATDAAPTGTGTGLAGTPSSDQGTAAATTDAGSTTAPTPPPPPPAEPADEFNVGAAKAALAAAAGQASGCRQPGDPSGTAKVAVTFASSGRATVANVQGPPFAGTSTGGCIAQVFKTASVPPFKGGPTTVAKTVTIQ